MEPLDARHDSVRGMTQTPLASRDRTVVVVGGANVDLLGVACGGLDAEDSNIGRISESPGGVGRNIAENLARLGVRPHLISAFGTDAHGRWLREECTRDGIDIEGAIDVAEVPGSRYLAISDAYGDMRLALNDMRALDFVTPAALAHAVSLLKRATLVVADTNIPTKTLAWLADTCTAPLLIDPVSSAKAARVSSLLDRVYALKLNVLEAGALLGQTLSAEDGDACEAAASALLDRGVTRVFLTRGAAGVIAADGAEMLRLPAPCVTIANVTGAGDAFSAGVAYATLGGMSLRQSAEIGSMMAALALASERTVSLAIDPNAVPPLSKES